MESLLKARKGRGLAEFLAVLAVAAVLLLFFSASSPLYPTNDWVDANCFLTVARGMRAGMVPYRDLMEQKGPLLYALHLPAVMISGNSFLGAWVLEVLCHALFLLAALRIVRLFARKYVAPVLLAVFALMLGAYAYCSGSAESICLPMLAWSLYDALHYFMEADRPMSLAVLLRNGLLAGCVFWIKYSIVGLHFAWMAVIAIECLVRRRSLLPPLKMCALFLAGMALATLPWLIYFGVHGALDDLIQIYFVQNIVDYGADNGLIHNIVHGLGNDMLNSPMLSLLGLAGIAFLLFGLLGRPWIKVLALAMPACLCILVYWGGWGRGYTFYVWCAFLPLAAAALCRLLECLAGRGRRVLSGVLALCLAVGCLSWLPFDRRDLLRGLGVPREYTVQSRFAKEINKTENPTLLNCGFLDGGFYLAAEVLPTERWFCKLNVNKDECFAAQSSAVAEGRVDYVVTNGKTLAELDMDDSRYDELLLQGAYRLYRKKGLSAAAQ